MTNLVHEEVASTRQVEVACTEPGLTSLFVGNGLGSRVWIISELSTSHVTACVINPNGAESNLRVRVCLRSGKRATEVIREVGRNTIFDSALGLRTGVRLQLNAQLVRTVHDTSFTIGAVRAPVERIIEIASVGRTVPESMLPPLAPIRAFMFQ